MPPVGLFGGIAIGDIGREGLNGGNGPGRLEARFTLSQQPGQPRQVVAEFSPGRLV